MQISVCFCKACISLKNLENIQISVNMINRLDITDEYSVKYDFILNTVTFIDAALNISLSKLWKCNVLWFYLFGQGVPNETKGTINLIHRSSLCRAPNSEQVKMAELSGLLWWNFAYTLILTRCSPRDCQMSFGIGRGDAEVQILKNSETGPITWNVLNILIKVCINIATDVS